MIAILARIGRLESGERKLVVEALTALAFAAFVIAVFPFHRIAALVGEPPARPLSDCDARTHAIEQVRWAIGACARRVPWRAKCFEQGLAAFWLLRRRSIEATLHYGAVQRAGEGLAAHVWVQAGSTEVIGCENSADFVELARFPPKQG